MKYIELQPIKDSPEDYEKIQKLIADFFKKEIYLPILSEIGAPSIVLKNSIEDLTDAISSGRITYDRGKFEGKFDARTSRELKKLGATWDSDRKCFRTKLSDLTPDIVNAIRRSEDRFKKELGKIDKKLSEVDTDKLFEGLKMEDLFETVLWKTDKKLKTTIRNISVTPKLNDDEKKAIAKEYSNSLKLPIKNWAKDQIKKLRKEMHESVFEGNRYEGMVKKIQDSYGVSQRKAKFLARQETNLLMATYKQARYANAGVHEYKWRSVIGSTNHPTRPRHKALNDASSKGKRFRFDDPPVTTEPGEPERRNNPGCDWNCRCAAIPVVRFG